jgi:hypothetical protein
MTAQLAFHMASVITTSFAAGFIAALAFVRWRDRRRPPPF